jgi:hypothetical protein
MRSHVRAGHWRAQVPAAQLTSAFTMDEPALRRHLYAAQTRQPCAARHRATYQGTH